MITPSKCRSCKAAIRFAVTVNGVSQPINFEPDPNGNLVIEQVTQVRDGHAIAEDRVRRFEPLLDIGKPRYMPHHAVCAFADQHRKKKR